MQEREHDFSTFEITNEATLTQKDDAHKAMYTAQTQMNTHREREGENGGRRKNRMKFFLILFISPTCICMHVITI